MILTKKKFTRSVEELVIEKKLTYIDAIVYFCQENHLEPESVKGLITPPLKEKIKAEAIGLRVLKDSSQAKLAVSEPALQILLPINEMGWQVVSQSQIKPSAQNSPGVVHVKLQSLIIICPDVFEIWDINSGQLKDMKCSGITSKFIIL